MKSNGRQYTVRGVPPSLDRALRKRAKEQGRSLNDILLETLHRGAGVNAEPTVYTDLDDIIGTWVEDPEFDEALRAQDQVDPSLWR